MYFVALAIVPLLSAVSFALLQMRFQSERQIINQLDSVAELKQGQIDQWMENNALVIDGFLSDANKRDRMASLIKSHTTDIAAQTRLKAELRALAALRTRSADSRFRSFFLYDRQGSIRVSSNEADIDKVVINQPYFASSLKATYVQPPYYAVGDTALTMLLTQPLRDTRGQTIGVLAGVVNLDKLGQIMSERAGLGVSGETYLVSPENNYLLTPSRSSEYPLNRAYHSQGIDAALQGQQGATVYDNYYTPAVRVIGSYRWIPTLHTALIAEINEAEGQTLFTQTALLSAALAGATAIIAILAGWFVATRVARPITSLAQVASQITAGALDQRAVVTSQNEIGLLASAFNRMADSLHHTLAGLEQRVAERTNALAQANAEALQAVADLRESLRARDLLTATVRELASPVMPVMDGIVVMPLIGVIDSARAALLVETLLTAIEQHRSRIAIIDVTGVPIIDTQVAQVLLRAASATRLLGTTPVLVGLRPELAQTIVGLGLDLRGIITCADLQSGVRYALTNN